MTADIGDVGVVFGLFRPHDADGGAMTRQTRCAVLG